MGLCIAVDVPLTEGTVARALLTQRDAAIYTEDTFEIFLQPPGLPDGIFYQFMVSARGTQLDARYAGGSVDVSGRGWHRAGGGQPGPAHLSAAGMVGQ